VADHHPGAVQVPIELGMIAAVAIALWINELEGKGALPGGKRGRGPARQRGDPPRVKGVGFSFQPATVSSNRL